jgi:hypothetical protein
MKIQQSSLSEVEDPIILMSSFIERGEISESFNKNKLK